MNHDVKRFEKRRRQSRISLKSYDFSSHIGVQFFSFFLEYEVDGLEWTLDDIRDNPESKH